MVIFNDRRRFSFFTKKCTHHWRASFALQSYPPWLVTHAYLVSYFSSCLALVSLCFGVSFSTRIIIVLTRVATAVTASKQAHLNAVQSNRLPFSTIRLILPNYLSFNDHSTITTSRATRLTPLLAEPRRCNLMWEKKKRTAPCVQLNTNTPTTVPIRAQVPTLSEPIALFRLPTLMTSRLSRTWEHAAFAVRHRI